MTISTPEFKTCCNCNTTKPISEFGIDNGRKDGRQPYCRECRRKIQRDYTERNREKNLSGTMGQSLIPILQWRIGAAAVNTVDARELHEFLESKQKFSDWIQNRIENYSFVENQDYIVFHNSTKNSAGGRPATEYHITLDMAKELSMVERTEKGREARRYFIECERIVKQGPALPAPEPKPAITEQAIKDIIAAELQKALAPIKQKPPAATSADQFRQDIMNLLPRVPDEKLEDVRTFFYRVLSGKKWRWVPVLTEFECEKCGHENIKELELNDPLSKNTLYPKFQMIRNPDKTR